MNEVKQARNRARRYWQIDGINELVVGGGVAWIGIVFVLGVHLDSDPLRYAGIANMLISAFVLSRLHPALKERITGPRTGHVSFPRSKLSHGHKFLLFMVVGVLTYEFSQSGLRDLSILDIPIQDLLFQAAVLLPIALLCIVRAVMWGMPRLLFIAAAALAACALTWGGQASDALTLALWLVLPGATAATTGTWGLICYLKENPLQLEEGDHVS